MKKRMICLSAICVFIVIAVFVLISIQAGCKQAENAEWNPEQGENAEILPDQSPFVIFPENVEIPPGFIFYAWEKDASGKIIQSSGIRNAVYQDVSNLRNVFAIPSAYAQAGETFELPLYLCGKVNLCAFDLRIAYDSSLLRYAGCEEMDDNLLINCDHKNGILYLNFIRVENLPEGFPLCNLAFQVLTSLSCESVLQVEVKDAVVLEENGDIVRCDAFSVDSVLYLNT